MSSEPGGDGFDLSPEAVGDLGTPVPGTEAPGTPPPFAEPTSPAVVEYEEEMAVLQEEYAYVEGADPAMAPEPTTPGPGPAPGEHPDPSSVPPDAPTDAHYGHDGELEEGPAPTSHVIGDPDGDAGQWSFQGANGYCGPNSLSMLLEQSTGQHFSEGEVATWAIDNGEMTHLPAGEDSPPGVPSLHYGMLPQQAVDTINALGEQYGVSASLEQGDMGDLESALKNGHEVMIEVDDEQLWHEQGVPDSGQANHFVVVTGFDPSTNTVYLNDPGTPDGREEAVPLSDFQSAWTASDNAMITVDQGGGGTGEATDEGAGANTVDYHDMSSWSGPVMLPIHLGGSGAATE